MYILLILFLGLILRLISLNQSLWLDEATTALVSKMSLSDIFTRFLPGDFHPPLYYLIIKYWTVIFSYSEVSLRIPSIIFGVGTIYFTYLIAKKLFNQKVGIISAILLATSGLSVYYSQEARMYSLAAFLVAVFVYLFIEKKWLLFSLVLPILAMTDYVSLFILPVFWLVGYKDWKKLAKAHIPMVVVFAIWIPVFFKQLTSGLSLKNSVWWNLLGTATFKNIALIPVKFVLGRISFDDKFIYGLIVTLVLLLFSFLLFKAKNYSKLIWFWLLVPVIIGILVSFKIPSLTYFRFLFCLPALYILTSAGIEKTGKYKKLFLIIIVLINLLCTLYYVLNPRFWREDWRAAATTIGQDVVVFPSDSQKEALTYYGKGSQVEFFKGFKGTSKEIWLSRYVWQVFDPTDSARQKVENLGYNKVTEYNFNGIVFWKYARSH